MDFENSENYKKIFKFISSTEDKLLSRESSTVEFKESFNWGSKDKYAKSMAAFANNRGGYLIFGVKNDPKELVGLRSNNFNDIDEAVISKYLDSVFSPEIEFEKNIIKIRSKNIGVLHVFQSQQKPVVALKNDDSIKDGEIYYRYNARNEKIRFSELHLLINQIKEKEKKQWMELFKQISHVGLENTALINMAEGKIEGKTGTLIIDHKLIPKLKFINEGKFKETGKPALKLIGEVRPVSIVGSNKVLKTGEMRITDNPNAPEFRINEGDILKEFPLDYKTLTTELKKRYPNFKADNKYHKIRRNLKTQGYSYTRKLNPKNEKSSAQDFYSLRIYKEFDKFYKLK